jgi:hypothetical protein
MIELYLHMKYIRAFSAATYCFTAVEDRLPMAPADLILFTINNITVFFLWKKKKQFIFKILITIISNYNTYSFQKLKRF